MNDMYWKSSTELPVPFCFLFVCVKRFLALPYVEVETMTSKHSRCGFWAARLKTPRQQRLQAVKPLGMKGLIHNQTEVDLQLHFPAGMNRVYLYCCHCYCRHTSKYIARILHWPHGLWTSNPHERVDSAVSNRNQWLTECLSATLLYAA